ncbi:hypothetical protein Gotri_007954, partial [Gossypium trilobum]|nr:hypothetical protein [Gossypium trilobum]
MMVHRSLHSAEWLFLSYSSDLPMKGAKNNGRNSKILPHLYLFTRRQWCLPRIRLLRTGRFISDSFTRFPSLRNNTHFDDSIIHVMCKCQLVSLLRMACRGCLECLLKLLNFLMTVAGLAMVGYGFYLFVKYKDAADTVMLFSPVGSDQDLIHI